MKTPQTEQWQGDFGRQYTDRNSLRAEALNALYQKNYGVTRRELNQRFLELIPRDGRILEVGRNEGNQLCELRKMGFQRLYGIEIQDYAVRRARRRLKSVRLVRANAFEIPYPDGFFDVVFTSGVLIHIAPCDLRQVLREIHRCAGGFIWGFEYYAAQPTEVGYRGQPGLLWKADFARLYLEQFADLAAVRIEHVPYLQDGNVDSMFLLAKKNHPAALSRRRTGNA